MAYFYKVKISFLCLQTKKFKTNELPNQNKMQLSIVYHQTDDRFNHISAQQQIKHQFRYLLISISMIFSESKIEDDDFFLESNKSKVKKVSFMNKLEHQRSITNLKTKHSGEHNQLNTNQNHKNKRQTVYDSYKGQSQKQYQSSQQQQHSSNVNANLRGKNQQKVSSVVLIRCLFSYIKKVRVLPTIMVSQLQKRANNYDSQDSLIYYPFGPGDRNFRVKTREGKNGVRQLIGFLEELQSMQSNGLAKEAELQWSEELHLAASSRVSAIQKGNSHNQGLDVGELVNQYGSWKGPLYEIVVYGFFDPKEILMQAFLQDDSVSKNNRKELFNQGAKFVGIDMGHHEEYRIVTVMIFAGGVGKVDTARTFRGDNHINEHCQCSIC